jgi:hypothetical protein
MSGNSGGMDRKRRDFDWRVERFDSKGISRQEYNNQLEAKEY